MPLRPQECPCPVHDASGVKRGMISAPSEAGRRSASMRVTTPSHTPAAREAAALADPLQTSWKRGISLRGLSVAIPNAAT